MKDNLTDSLSEKKASPILGTRENPFSVSDLNRKVKLELEGQYSGIWLVGEISNFIAHRSGHYYFSLKDEISQIASVMFYQSNRKMKFLPEDGLEVLLYGKLSLYTPRGTYQIIVEKMEPKGIGSLQFAYEQLQKKLASEGLFDKSRKKPIPQFPRTVAIITSPTGAAIRDLLRVLEKIAIEVLIFPSRVQGEEAAGEIIRGLEILNNMTEIDLLILSRGGGSLEDLWPFNEEPVARAIASSRIPVMTAIGHETDITIADLVSDLRAPTPSAAAALIVQNRRDLESGLDQLLLSLSREARIFIVEKRERISALMHRRGILGLEGLIKENIQNVDEYSRRLAAHIEARLQNALSQWHLTRSKLSFQRIQSQLLMEESALQSTQKRLYLSVKQVMGNARAVFSTVSGLLHSLSPLSVLKRGYSICRTTFDGKIVRQSTEVSEGQHVDIKLFKGSLLCKIKERYHDEKNRKT